MCRSVPRNITLDAGSVLAEFVGIEPIFTPVELQIPLEEEGLFATVVASTVEELYIWDVYSGKTPPADDEEWLLISEWCRFRLYLVADAMIYHFDWQPAQESEAVSYTFV